MDWHNWQGEMLATLMFVVRDGQILLIEKLRGIGMGKINGPGGKIDPGETPAECVIRECQEELHITPKEPVKMGELWFAMSDMEDIHCHVYMASEFDGVPTVGPDEGPAGSLRAEHARGVAQSLARKRHFRAPVPWPHESYLEVS